MKLTIEKSTLDGIGNAIRTKKGSSDLIAVPNLAEEILSIPSGSGGIEGFDVETGTFVLYQDWIFANQTMHNPYVIEHHLGKTPIMFDLMIEDCVVFNQHTVNNAYIKVNHHHSRSQKEYSWVFNNVYRANADTGQTASTVLLSSCAFPISDADKANQMLYADENNIYLGGRNSPNTYNYILRAGNTYRWIAYARKEG